MRENKLILEGHKYEGIFRIKEHTETYVTQVSTEVGYHNESITNHYWKGKGIIINKQESREQKFLIFPKGNNESDFIFFDCKDRDSILKRIQDYKGIVDVVLQFMYEEALEKSGQIIAEIRPKSLNIEELVELGLLSEESGQMRISLVA